MAIVGSNQLLAADSDSSMFSFTRTKMPLHHLAALYISEGKIGIYKERILRVMLDRPWRSTLYLRRGWLIRVFGLLMDHPAGIEEEIKGIQIEIGLLIMERETFRRLGQEERKYVSDTQS
jgi:hypothetical protein